MKGEYEGANFKFSFDSIENTLTIEEIATGKAIHLIVDQDDLDALYVCTEENTTRR